MSRQILVTLHDSVAPYECRYCRLRQDENMCTAFNVPLDLTSIGYKRHTYCVRAEERATEFRMRLALEDAL